MTQSSTARQVDDERLDRWEEPTQVDTEPPLPSVHDGEALAELYAEKRRRTERILSDALVRVEAA